MRLRERWRGRILELLLTLLGVAIIVSLFLRFTGWVERRSGVILEDPILQAFAPVDLSWPIFGIIYGGLVVAIVILVQRPDDLLVMLRAYGLLVLVRMGAMWVTPLDPPESMILLVDPIAGVGPGGVLTRDLFFSGHTATMILLALGMRRRIERILFFIAALLLAAFLLMQHVHYTVDILASPFFAWGCFRVSRLLYMSGP
jgi:hypothetical protein